MQVTEIDGSVLLREFHQSIEEICKSIKVLHKYIDKEHTFKYTTTKENTENEEQLFYQISINTLNLIKNSKLLLENEEYYDPQLSDFLLAMSKKIRTKTLEYMKAIKSAIRNSMDYMTISKENEKFIKLEKCLKATNYLSDILERSKYYKCKIPSLTSSLSTSAILPSLDRLQPIDNLTFMLDKEMKKLIAMANKLATQTKKMIEIAMEGDPLSIMEASGNLFPLPSSSFPSSSSPPPPPFIYISILPT